jgi:hypothetical protein
MDPKRQDEQNKARKASDTDALRDLPEQDNDRSETTEQDENVKGGMLPPARRAALE